MHFVVYFDANGLNENGFRLMLYLWSNLNELNRFSMFIRSYNYFFGLTKPNSTTLIGFLGPVIPLN